VQFDLELPAELEQELIAAPQERHCSLEKVCAEAVEVLLAERRALRLRPEDCYARKGPRQPIADGDL